MNNEATAAICAALKEFDDWGSFLFQFADPMWDHYASGGYDPEGLDDPVKLAEHRREAAEFDLGFAGGHKSGLETLVEKIKAVIAAASPPDPERSDDERLWHNFCVSFECYLDRDMEARWRALQIVMDHYRAHPPDDPVKLSKHYREMGMFAMDYVFKLCHERAADGPCIRKAAA
jgi:hypothetical protein